ncbi:MAG TPA: UDP-N-acetylmuramoyl-tripeptide--D-alanyl-D-alanine ligase [Verrucomicrobiae bacterium]|nr:UDP-N-acetylmuramoyl-tripeptide--D-alanyl-D-alanine ligase [Verrucomicrobiae bacterium]
MEARNIQFILSACDGKRFRGETNFAVQRVCTDSRRAQPGDLFIALRGDRFDGHEFLGEAAAKGVAAVMIDEKKTTMDFPDCAVIIVDDTRKALGKFAARYRNDFSPAMIAVGGSNGKTTTKELIASVLRQKLNTLWSDASFNNDIGVPLTLLRLENLHQAAVLEAGTNHPGELAPLVKMIRPDFGIVTSIGREHLEFFGNLEGVADEEGALAEWLPGKGKLFLNGDNEWTSRIAKRASADVVRVGFDEINHWRATEISPDKSGVSFQVSAPGAEFSGGYRIHLFGRHQVVNALFAICLGAELGLNRAEIQRGLSECPAPKMRLQFCEPNGVGILDDSYNANLDSMIAALETLRDFPCKGRRVAVLGDMAELGIHSEAAHEQAGRSAAELGVGQLFAVGEMAPVTARGARNAGLNRVLEFNDVDTAAAAVKSFLKPGDVVLLKASRAARLERVAELLRGGEAARKN